MPSGIHPIQREVVCCTALDLLAQRHGIFVWHYRGRIGFGREIPEYAALRQTQDVVVGSDGH